MDCHEPNTHMQLIGVYKESDGLMEWAEQLFKHQVSVNRRLCRGGSGSQVIVW